MDAAKISVLPPASDSYVSYPRFVEPEPKANHTMCGSRKDKTVTVLEIDVEDVEHKDGAPAPNLFRAGRVRCQTRIGIVPGKLYKRGPISGTMCVLKNTVVMSPAVRVREYDAYVVPDEQMLSSTAADGAIFTISPSPKDVYYVYCSPAGDTGYRVMRGISGPTLDFVEAEMLSLTRIGLTVKPIAHFLSREYMGHINNLSPRAWDSRRIQKEGSVYTPKIDGERVYVLYYSGIMHVFSRQKDGCHVGMRVLSKRSGSVAVVVVDAENTVTNGIYVIDMLTDSDGNLAPRSRDYRWALKEHARLEAKIRHSFTIMRPYLTTLSEAEALSQKWECPTDGVIALWPGTTTSRKMKEEKSIELKVDDTLQLVTSNEERVFSSFKLPPGVSVGSIVEARLRLVSGEACRVSTAFVRQDKSSANSSAAVLSILSSFDTVTRDEEAQRREVLMWCDSLRRSLFERALTCRGTRKIVLDIGTGTGQCIDTFRPDIGVSYILLEPDASRCRMISSRTGCKCIITEADEVLSIVKPLKSGAVTYSVVNLSLRQLLQSEAVMNLLKEEVAFCCAFFSAQHVTTELYDICGRWGLPLTGCMYPYDSVGVGEYLVNSLGVKMRRTTPCTCSVSWGRDEVYTEPYTVLQDYRTFCSVSWGRDEVYTEPYTVLQDYRTFCSVSHGLSYTLLPPGQLQDDVYDICSKVRSIENFQGRFEEDTF
ncbi:hypothetical protein K3495_g717 [Podosphaera aphanis]|nr:hypothetical protein K3495_g717 [Podosphaera aphanis]